MSAYAVHLDQSLLQGHSSRTYISAARGYLRWLESMDIDGDPLTEHQTRDRAVRGYVRWLTAAAERKPATVNKAIAMLDDFYRWRGMGKCGVDRVHLAHRKPPALDREAVLRYLRAADMCDSSRDRAIALVLYYTGARISEVSALNVTDVTAGPGDAVRGAIRLTDTSGRQRTVPVHSALNRALSSWLAEHPSRFDVDEPLFLSRRHTRMTPDALYDIVSRITQTAKLGDRVTASILRRTFKAHLIRKGAPSTAVANLMGLRGTADAESAQSGYDLNKVIASLPEHTQPRLILNNAQSDPAARASARRTQAKFIRQAALADPANTDLQKRLWITHRQLGDEAVETGDLVAARDEYQASLDISTKLVRADPANTDWLRDKALIHARLGDIAAKIAAKELEIAHDAYRASLAISSQVASSDPADTDWQQGIQVIIQHIRDLIDVSL